MSAKTNPGSHMRVASGEHLTKEMPQGISFKDMKILGLLEEAGIGTRMTLPSGITAVRVEDGLAFVVNAAPALKVVPEDPFSGAVTAPSGTVSVDASVPAPVLTRKAAKVPVARVISTPEPEPTIVETAPAPEAEVVQTSVAPPAAKTEIKAAPAPKVEDIVEEEVRAERAAKAAAHAANAAARAAVIPGLVIALVALAKEFLREGGHVAGLLLEETYIKSGPFATRVVAEGIQTIEDSVVLDGRALMSALRALPSGHPLRGMVDAMVKHGPHAVRYDRIIVSRTAKGRTWILPLWSPVAAAVTDRLKDELVVVARHTQLKDELRRRLMGGAVVKGGRKIARHNNGSVDWDTLHAKFGGTESLEGRKVTWGHLALVGDWAFCLDASEFDKATVLAVAAELTDEFRQKEREKCFQDINWGLRSVNGVKLIPFTTRKTPEGAYRVDRTLKQDGTCPISRQDIPQHKGGAFHFLVYAPRGASQVGDLMEEMGYVPLLPRIGYALKEDPSLLPNDWEVWERWEIVEKFSATVAFVVDKSIKLEPTTARRGTGSVSLSSRKLKEERSDAEARKALAGGSKKKGGGSKKTTRRLRPHKKMADVDEVIESWASKSPEELGQLSRAMIHAQPLTGEAEAKPTKKRKKK